MNGRKVALIIFYDKSNRILLQDRRKISKRGEEWGFFGGGIEEGETPEQALIRETKEELGYDLKEFEYIGNYKNTLDDGFTIDRYIFVSPLKDKASKFQLYEGEGMQLFSISEAIKLKRISGDAGAFKLIAKHLGVVE